MGASRSARNEITVRLEGGFDVRSARRLERIIEDAPAGATVRVDLSRVRDFDDFGIAVLAQTLEHLETISVRLHGLRAPQARMIATSASNAGRFGAAPKGGRVPDSAL